MWFLMNRSFPMKLFSHLVAYLGNLSRTVRKMRRRIRVGTDEGTFSFRMYFRRSTNEATNMDKQGGPFCSGYTCRWHFPNVPSYMTLSSEAVQFVAFAHWDFFEFFYMCTRQKVFYFFSGVNHVRCAFSWNLRALWRYERSRSQEKLEWKEK